MTDALSLGASEALGRLDVEDAHTCSWGGLPTPALPLRKPGTSFECRSQEPVTLWIQGVVAAIGKSKTRSSDAGKTRALISSLVADGWMVRRTGRHRAARPWQGGFVERAIGSHPPRVRRPRHPLERTHTSNKWRKRSCANLRSRSFQQLTATPLPNFTAFPLQHLHEYRSSNPEGTAWTRWPSHGNICLHDKGIASPSPLLTARSEAKAAPLRSGFS